MRCTLPSHWTVLLLVRYVLSSIAENVSLLECCLILHDVSRIKWQNNFIFLFIFLFSHDEWYSQLELFFFPLALFGPFLLYYSLTFCSCKISGCHTCLCYLLPHLHVLCFWSYVFFLLGLLMLLSSENSWPVIALA